MSVATTSLWLLPFSLWQTVLSVRVGSQRAKTGKMLGDSTVATAPNAKNPDPLYLSSRAHANFLETVPLALVFAGVAELNGANKTTLNYLLGVLFVLRIIHVQFGLSAKDCNGPGRPLGYLGTQLIMTVLAGWSGWLAKGTLGL